MGVGDWKLELLVMMKRYAFMAFAGLVGPLAFGQQPDQHWFRPNAEYTYSYDSNLFRIPDQAVPAAGRGQLSDTFRSVSTGLIIDRRLGRQTINASVKVTRTDFNRFENIDFDGRDVKVNLNWRIGSDLSGRIGNSSAKSLTPFTELNDGGRNIRTSDQKFANAVLRLKPSLQLTGGVADAKFEFDLFVQRPRNRRIKSQDVGLDYVPPSGNRLGLMLRRSDAKFPNDAPGVPIRLNDYIETELKLRVDWKLSGKTAVRFVGGKTQRKHEILPIRDFDGVNARLIATMAPTGKQVLTLNLFREVGPVDNLITSFTINQGATLDTVWVIDSKFRLDGRLSYEKRDFNSFGGFTSDRSDLLRNATLSLTYSPFPYLQVGVSAFRDTLDSNQAFRTYRANGVAANIRFQY